MKMNPKVIESLSEVPVQVSKETPGRFQLVTNDANTQATFLVDTATGRTWLFYHAAGAYGWRPMHFFDPSDNFDSLLQRLTADVKSDQDHASLVHKIRTFGEEMHQMISSLNGRAK